MKLNNKNFNNNKSITPNYSSSSKQTTNNDHMSVSNSEALLSTNNYNIKKTVDNFKGIECVTNININNLGNLKINFLKESELINTV